MFFHMTCFFLVLTNRGAYKVRGACKVNTEKYKQKRSSPILEGIFLIILHDRFYRDVEFCG